MELTAKLDALINDADALLTQLADSHSPHVQVLRDRIDKAVAETRNAMVVNGAQARVDLQGIAYRLDDYVHDFPWLAIAGVVTIAASLAFAAGFAVGAGQNGTTR